MHEHLLALVSSSTPILSYSSLIFHTVTFPSLAIGLSSRSTCPISHRKLVLVCGAKWKRPVKRVYGIGRKGNGAICAPNRQNESSPIGSISLWSGLHFAPQTSTSLHSSWEVNALPLSDDGST